MAHFTGGMKSALTFRFLLTLAASCILVMAAMIHPVLAQQTEQKTFATPEDALNDLIGAAAANNSGELLAIFGPEGKDLVLTGNEGEDAWHRRRFVRASEELKRIEYDSENRAILHFGREDWPLPIPLIKKGNVWIFDTKSGKEEILNRRIGRNELRAIDVCKEYPAVQREYASKDRDGTGVLKYAKKIVSSSGKQDGLFWIAGEGQERSPFGPFIAEAAVEQGSGKSGSGMPMPYHGYFYRILKSQGKSAPGGAYKYVINNNMVAGFALVAFPADYGTTGIMTFIVNQNGQVYQKDLGKKTNRVARSMKQFNPDSTWKKVD